MVNSQAIDEYPMWSPNSDYIACNIDEQWYKFRLTNIEFAEAQWHKKKIGTLATKEAYSKMTETEQSEFEKVSKLSPREVVTKDKTKIELKTTGMSVSLIVTKKGGQSRTLWTSNGENCHSLVLSPDEKYVAYLCEMNGLFIISLK
jgi:Tol biopolymer transport system component